MPALRLAREQRRVEPMLGMTTWWVQHADPHLRILMDPKQGPFADCSPEGHTQSPFAPLPNALYEPGPGADHEAEPGPRLRIEHVQHML
ncbi:DUF4913 domain-containing protein [Streptomyces lavendulae]|uniref:DUF4913 domain-containing protein n=1 Tax=Streptomyces lavendulae TaxID=1914 RepID=UPI0036CBB12D